MTDEELISRCYCHGQPDYILAADRIKELLKALRLITLDGPIWRAQRIAVEALAVTSQTRGTP